MFPDSLDDRQDMVSIEDAPAMEAMLLARAYLYMLFHKLFGGSPTDELLQITSSDVTLDVVDEYADDDESMAGLLAFLRKVREGGVDAVLEQAKDEYTRIFVGPVNLPASPYEAPYTGSHDMALFQENTLQVRRLYRADGLQAKRLQRVPDDHVSLMCHYLALLAQRSLAAFDEGDGDALVRGLRQQHSFVGEHMGNWLGLYAKAVRDSKAGDSAVLYPQMLEALAAFAQDDELFLREAAYWAEQVGDELAEGPVRFVDARDGLERLQAVRLFGLEDNELAPTPAE